MKKLFLLLTLLVLILSGCSFENNNDKISKLKEENKKLEDKIDKLKGKDEKELNTLNKNIKNKKLQGEFDSIKYFFKKPIESSITKENKYSLNCKTHIYTNNTIGGDIIKKSSISINKGHEKQILYINNNTANFFGAEFQVIQDDSSFLIIMRHNLSSGLTEVVTINKKIGIGYDIKTFGLGFSGAPVSDTYILKCNEI